MPQVGRVIIQNDVEIGAGTTIDRGANRDTVIGEGTKIDNLVQIGHNVVIGRHCVLVSQSGVSGSTVIGDFAALGGQAGLVGHLTIGPGAQIAAQAGVMGDVPAGGKWGGAPGPADARFLPRSGGVAQAGGGRRRQETRSRLIVWNSAPPQGGASAPAKLDGGPGTGHGPSPARKESDMAGGTGRTIETYDIRRLLDCLPHRYPMLLVDRIVEACGDESCIGIKNVSFNEPQFQGHFPERPVMPGVLLIEGMAQTAGALCVSNQPTGGRPSVVYLMTIDQAKFRKPVMPGDQVRYHMTRLSRRRNMWWYRGEAKVDGVLVCEATISAILVNE